ncbi:MAG: RHS repeat domain-containing protein [Bacteroidota bacterium]|jgi:RHS repeat-associated protein
MDYLGSARITLSTTAEPLQSSSYHPYGTERTSTGSGARTSYIGREHDKETDLGFYGVRLYEPEYGRFLSTDVLWGAQLSLQPYHYAINNPVNAADASGLLWGAIIGAAVEIASQMVFENKSASEIDCGRVCIAAIAGAATGGLASLTSTAVRKGALTATAAVRANVGGVAAISVAEGATKRVAEGKETTANDIAADGAAGVGAGLAGEALAIVAKNSTSGKMVQKALRREENILAGGRTRATQVAAVESARAAVDQLGRGFKEEVITGSIELSLSCTFQEPAVRDNTAVVPKPNAVKP